jgi:hypothetical protein
MKMINIFSSVVLFSISVFFFSSCRQQPKTTQPTEDTTTINREEVQASVNEIIEFIPSPFELTTKLDEIGAGYIENAVNPTNKLDKYFTEKNKALNLGVYGADLAYVSTYDKKQEINEYASVVKILVDQLNINVDFAELSSEETKAKFENKDTLVNTVANTFYNVYKFLNENSDPSLAALVATGLWVEGMYLAMQISEETYNNNEFVKIIFDQKNSLSKLIELLDLFKDEQMITAQKNALKKLHEQYGTTGSLTIEQLNTIAQTVTTIRSGIVE